MSVKKNFAYNTAITVSSYIASFITYPYISRILGVDNIGAIGYVSNIVNYFMMITMLGVGTVGIREIAAVSNDKERTSKVFSQIVSFLFLSVSLSVVVYSLCMIFVPSFSHYRIFMLIGLCQLLVSPFTLEWLYAGNQDFKYISIRSIIIRIIYVLAIFIFVRDRNDTSVYFSLTASSILLSVIVNIIYARKYIDIKYFRFEPFAFIKPILKLGVFGIITSLYSTFNYIYLGSVATITQVGLYYTAIKLYDVIMQVFRSYTSVVMPKMSQYASTDDAQGFNSLLSRSYEALFSYSFPLAFCSIALSPFIISIISGSGYEGAITPMRIVMPILIIAGINQINGVQVLMPLKKDNVLIITGSVAAFVGVCSNILLDSRFGAIGAAITILASEATGCLCGLIYIYMKKLVVFPVRIFSKYLLTSIPYLIFYFVIEMSDVSFIISNVIMIVFMAIYFYIQQIYLCKNPIAINTITAFKSRLKNS